MNYVNDGLPFLINSKITEYDIKSGNTSMMKRYQLQPPEVIAEIEKMEKKQRNVTVGLIQKQDRTFAKRLEESFDRTVKEFIEKNGLDIDVDVLAVRKDAVFVVNHPVTITQLDSNVLFREKSQYHAALQIGPRLEFYFTDQNDVEIKNFVTAEKDDNQALEKLKPGMISFLREFVEIAEGTNMNRVKVYQWLRDFCTYYKQRDLDVEYYREFTREALFHIRLGEDDTYYDQIPDTMIEDLDISFNYRNIIIPLLQILI